VRRHGYCPRDRSPFIGRSPHSHLQASRAKSPPTCSRVPTPRHGGWVPHVVRADPKREGGKPPHACNRPAVISVPSSSPKPADERASRRVGSIQPRRGYATFRLRHIRWTNTEAQSHISCNRRYGHYMQGNCTATCANAASSRLWNQCRDSRQPRA
jgi:hypothetical protein